MIGVVLLTAIGLITAFAPVLAPNPPETQYAGLAYAPPMFPRIVHDGRLQAPFIYPLVMRNRLERDFGLDRIAFRADDGAEHVRDVARRRSERGQALVQLDGVLEIAAGGHQDRDAPGPDAAVARACEERERR